VTSELPPEKITTLPLSGSGAWRASSVRRAHSCLAALTLGQSAHQHCSQLDVAQRVEEGAAAIVHTDRVSGDLAGAAAQYRLDGCLDCVGGPPLTVDEGAERPRGNAGRAGDRRRGGVHLGYAVCHRPTGAGSLLGVHL
jgi:hypothetical protein